MIPLRRWSGSAAVIACSGVLLISGCGPGGSTNPSNSTKFENSAPSASSTPASPPSAVPNSFDEVTARLDRGGAFYLYLSTAQWLDGLSGKISSLRASLPKSGISPADRKQMDQWFDLGTAFVKNTGIEQITGVGASSLAIEPGASRNTFFIHHYKGKETGLLNTLVGTAPHALTALNLLPADTALASSGDFDLPGLIHTLLRTIDQAGTPELKQAVAENLPKIQQTTGMTLDEFLASLGMEFDLVTTMDPAKQIEVPAGGDTTMKLPLTRVAFLIEVKDDKYFNKIDELLTQVPSIIKVDEPGLKMRTSTYPVLPDYVLRPTIARWDKFLIVATDDSLIRDMIAVQKGGPGFKASPTFARLSSGVPSEGNGFSVATRLFADTVRAYQQQTMAGQHGASAEQMEWIQKFLYSASSVDSYSVSSHVENGWLTVNRRLSGADKTATH